MKPTELRIGNFLYSPVGDAVLMVDELTAKNITTIVVNRNKYPLPSGWTTEGLPIAEKWLIRFGFELKDEVNRGFLKLTNKHLQEYLYCSDNGVVALYSTLTKERDFIINKKCDYVHQLQNLYFALTGEELR